MGPPEERKMNEYQTMYERVEEARLTAKTLREAIKIMESVARPYGKEFLVRANKWASMNRRDVPDEARMAVSFLIDDM